MSYEESGNPVDIKREIIKIIIIISICNLSFFGFNLICYYTSRTTEQQAAALKLVFTSSNEATTICF